MTSTTLTKLRAAADRAHYGVFYAANADSWRESISDVLPRLADTHPAKLAYLQAQKAVTSAKAA